MYYIQLYFLYSHELFAPMTNADKANETTQCLKVSTFGSTCSNDSKSLICNLPLKNIYR